MSFPLSVSTDQNPLPEGEGRVRVIDFTPGLECNRKTLILAFSLGEKEPDWIAVLVPRVRMKI